MTSPTALPGLLAVHAHPDDETLSSGALLATWARAGGEVTVVTCTRGERGEVIGPDPDALEGDGPRLATHREAELARALGSLGVRDHVFLDRVPAVDDDGTPAPYEDSGMAWVAGSTGTARLGADVPAGAFVRVPTDEAAARLATVLRDRRPGVVVTYEAGGGYGHPDHVRAHEVTVRAIELAGLDVALWHPSATSDDVTAATAALEADWARAAGLPIAPVTPAPSYVSDDRPVVVRVPVAPVADAVLGALRAHRTQVQAVTRAPDGAGVVGCYALSNDLLAPLRAHETYTASDQRAVVVPPEVQVAWPR